MSVYKNSYVDRYGRYTKFFGATSKKSHLDDNQIARDHEINSIIGKSETQENHRERDV
jgi:hypothetical protein